VFIEAATAEKKNYDVLGRNIAFYLATSPKCPTEIVELLYDHCGYDRQDHDIYGRTVAYWAALNGCGANVMNIITGKNTITHVRVEQQQPGIMNRIGSFFGTSSVEQVTKEISKLNVNKKRHEIVREKLEGMGLSLEEHIRQSFELSTVELVSDKFKDNKEQPDDSFSMVNYDAKPAGYVEPTGDLKVKLVLIETNEKVTTAVTVGSKLVEWGDKSLCTVRNCEKDGAIFAVDVGVITARDKSSKLKKASEVIADYNVNKEYGCNNCQKFVDEFLASVGITIKYTGIITDYINNVRKTGLCRRILHVTQDLYDQLKQVFDKTATFDKDTMTVTFDTHDELDLFIYAIKHHCFNFLDRDENKELNMLLKAFDRGFWLKHRHNENDERYKPCSRSCPYQDPSKTGTLWGTTTRRPSRDITKTDSSPNITPTSTATPKGFWFF
jgi:hypothetical protein